MPDPGELRKRVDCLRNRLRIALLLVLWVLAAVKPMAQNYAFEVSSVRPDNNLRGGESLRLDVHGRFSAGHITLEHLILFAFGLRGEQISGGPAWIGSDTFRIDAKVDDADLASMDQLPGTGQYDAYRSMVRKLLVERFRLKVEESERVLRVYELRQADGGSKLQAAGGAFGASVRSGTLSCKGCTVASLTNVLSDTLDAPVYDHTGLTGWYDFSLDWEESRTTAEQELRPDAISVKPSLREALQDQLGLKLQAERAPTPAIRILEASYPDAN